MAKGLLQIVDGPPCPQPVDSEPMAEAMEAESGEIPLLFLCLLCRLGRLAEDEAGVLRILAIEVEKAVLQIGLGSLREAYCRRSEGVAISASIQA